MIGTPVRHRGGVGQVTHVGHEGVTLDTGDTVRHGDYEPHEKDSDIVEISHGVADFMAGLPTLMRLPAWSRVGLAAAVALSELRALEGRGLDATNHLDGAAAAKLATPTAVAYRPGPVLVAKDRTGEDVPVDADAVAELLGRYGLSRDALSRWAATALYLDARDAGLNDAAAVAQVKRTHKARDAAGALLDPRVRSGYAPKRGDDETTGQRIRAAVRNAGGRDA